MDAVSALHQVISRRFDLVLMVIRRGWLSPAKYSLEFVIDESKTGKLPDAFVVQTKLFATPIGKKSGMAAGQEQFPKHLTSMKPYASQGGKDFYRFFGST